ncbi:hypothetical protein ACHAPT_013585 [Fusarium lateritium]
MCPTNNTQTICGRPINILQQPGRKMVWGAPCKCAMQDHIIRHRLTLNRIRRHFDDLLDLMYLRQHGREVENLMRPKVKDALERVVREMESQGLIKAREEDDEPCYEWRADADNFLGIGAWNHDWSEEASQRLQAAHQRRTRAVPDAAAPAPGLKSRNRACPPAPAPAPAQGQAPAPTPAPGKKGTTLDQKVSGCQTKTGGIGTGVIAGVGTIGGSVNYNQTIKIYHRHGDDDDEAAAAVPDSDDDDNDNLKHEESDDSDDDDDDDGWGFRVETDSEPEDVEMADTPPMQPTQLHQHTHDHRHEHRWKGHGPEVSPFPTNDDWPWPSPPKSPRPSPPPSFPSPPSSSTCAPSWDSPPSVPPSMPPSVAGWESLPTPPQDEFPAPPSTFIGWESAPSQRPQAPSTAGSASIPLTPPDWQPTTPRPAEPQRTALFPGPRPRTRPRTRPGPEPTTEPIPARQRRARSNMDRQAVRDSLATHTEQQLLQAVDEIAAALISDYTWKWKVNVGEDLGLVEDLTQRGNYRLDYLDVIGELLDDMSGLESTRDGIFARAWWWLEK